jgi:cytochrome c peroxidase
VPKRREAARPLARILAAVALAVGTAGVCVLPGAVGAWAAEARPGAPPRTGAGPAAEAPAGPKAELGKLLFWDPRASPSGKIACATCHRPDHGWSDPRPLPLGDDGRPMPRHAPTIINRAGSTWQLWSGRHTSLEAQALHEANRRDDLVDRLIARPGYRRRFRAAFGAPPTRERAAEAIAGFVRTVVSWDAPYDRFAAGDEGALSPGARRGFSLFSGKALCVNCHPPPTFTDEAFHNLGVGMDRPEPDPGRAEVHGNPSDTGAFKTPTLRDVALRGPYMHDGSLATLDDVVAFYDRGGTPNRWQSTQVRPLGLAAGERADLVAFLRALTGKVDPAVARPPARLP